MTASSYPDLDVRTERIREDILALAQIADPELPYTRQAFTAYDREGRRRVKASLEVAVLRGVGACAATCAVTLSGGVR